MKIIGKVYFCFVHQTPLLIGLSLGIALSLILIPLVEESCLFYEQTNLVHEDYEPIINLQIRPPERSKTHLIRPRYFSTELGIRDKLLVAILTSSSSSPSLEKTLLAINRTLSKHVNKLVYFVDSRRPLVSLPTVIGFSDSRPHLPLHALQYLSDNYIDGYDYFFIAKHTTFVIGPMIRKYVDELSVNQDVYIGHKSNGLNCNFNGGILLSNKVLRRVAKTLTWCVDHWSGTDDGFRDCISRGAGLSCANEVQGKKFSSYEISSFDFSWQSTSEIFKNEMHTIYSLTSPVQYYQLHYYFTRKEIEITKSNIQLYQNKMLDLSYFLSEGNRSVPWPIDIATPCKPSTRFDVIQWTYFNDSHLFLPNEMMVLSKISGIDKLDLDHVRNLCNKWVHDRCKQCKYERLLQGYRKFDPTRGMEYILDLVFNDLATDRKVMKRLQVLRPLTKTDIIPIPFVTEHTRIILILIIKSNNQGGSVKFLENYARSCLDKQDNTVLLLVFLYNPGDPGKGRKDDVFGSLKGLVNTYTTKYRSTGAKIVWLSIKTAGKVPSDFSIFDLVTRKLQPETMILKCQLNMEITSEYLNRVRMNTILNHQVFFPIPFVQFHPKVVYKNNAIPDYVEVKKDYGHFNVHNYEHMSFYVSDYLAARKSIEDYVPIVRSDKDLHDKQLYNLDFGIYEMFLKYKLIHIMRATEPALRIRFNLIYCDSQEMNKKAYHNCERSQESSIGTKSQLSALVVAQEQTMTEDHIKSL